MSGCVLVGGETAEMPGMYHEGDYDLAGFCVGVVEKSEIIDGTAVKTGDTLIALGSSGYSLIRKVLEVSGANPADLLEGKSLSGTPFSTNQNLCKIDFTADQAERSSRHCSLNRWRFLGKYPACIA